MVDGLDKRRKTRKTTDTIVQDVLVLEEVADKIARRRVRAMLAS